MTLWVMFTTFTCMFCCLGMVQQQQGKDDWKRNFNIAYTFFVWHQRALLVPFRRYWGGQSLGLPSLFGFLLMIVWVWASQDSYMFLWILFWIFMQLKRRIEAMRLSGQLHSLSDGIPSINLGANIGFAKLFLEPLFIGVLGWILFNLYTDNGLPYYSL